MTERYTGIPENLKIVREAAAGAYGRHKTEGADTASFSSGQRREQTGSPRENIHNASLDMHRRLRSSRGGTLAEIRDLLREQAILREIESIASVRKKVGDDLEKHREKKQRESEERGDKITIGTLLLSLLAGVLSAPVTAAEQSFEDTKHQAEQAA